MDRRNQGIVRGTLMGIGVGVVVGLLLAPRSGKETRDLLATRSKETMDDLERRLADLRSELGDRIDALKDLAATVSEEAGVQSRELISKAEVLKEDLHNSASNLAKNTGKAKSDAVADAKRLVKHGADIMSDLEHATREVVKNTKHQAKESDLIG